MLSIDANISGAHRMLDGIRDRLEDGDGLLRQLGNNLADYERDVFATRGDGTWGTADLVDTGALRDMLTGTPDFDLGDDTVEAEGPEYLRYLRAGARGAPPRDPAPVPPGYLQERWADDLLDTLLGQV